LEFARGVACLGVVLPVKVGIVKVGFGAATNVGNWFFLEYLMKVSINRLFRIGGDTGPFLQLVGLRIYCRIFHKMERGMLCRQALLAPEVIH